MPPLFRWLGAVAAQSGGWPDNDPRQGGLAEDATPRTARSPFRPARVLMPQDLTGVPAVVDLAEHARRHEGAGRQIWRRSTSPAAEADLVIDHSAVMVDNFGVQADPFRMSASGIERNQERYQFLRWGQQAFANCPVVPPGTGICHQVNLEYLAETVWVRRSGQRRGARLSIMALSPGYYGGGHCRLATSP